MTERDDDEPPAKPPPPKVDPSKPPPPPMVGKIADVAPFEPMYEPPPGAMSAPRQAPIWRSDGKRTGQLAAPQGPLPKTVELEMPEVRSSDIPATRELESPEGASGLFAETTYILNAAQLRGEAPAPMRSDAQLEPDLEEDRTDQIAVKAFAAVAVHDTSTIDDTDSPLADDFDDPTAPHPVMSFHEETTAILKGQDVPPSDEDDE